VPRVLSSICLVGLLLVAPAGARAVEYELQVANLTDGGFAFFVRGPVGRGEGELALPRLERALDAAEVSRGVLLYDRDLYPAGEGVARSFGAVAVRPTGSSTSEDRGLWKTVRWEGRPGERVVWVMRPATMHWRQVEHVALDGGGAELRYYVPYRVSLSPRPAPVVAYSLTLLRSGEDGAPLWERFLSRGVDPSRGLAAVIGFASTGGDWVYFVIEQPPAPTTFRAVIGWARRGVHDRVEAGAGPGIRNR
jgi:hypothetical protein